MNTDRDKKHSQWSASPTFILLLLLVLSGCSLPKIIVLHDPLSAEEHVKLGGIYDSQGKTGLARDQYREAARQDSKSVHAWSLLGDAAYKMKEYEEAEEAYRKALDLDPKNGDLLNNLAWVSIEQGRDLDTALELTQKAMELNPDHRPYYLDTLGFIQLKLGKVRESIVSLRESTETIPQDQPELLAEAYQHLADAYGAAGDIAAADAALERQRQLRLSVPNERVPQP